MNERQTHLDWRFGLQWVVSCAVGTAVVGMVAYSFMWLLAEAAEQSSNQPIGVSVAGLLFGAFLALGGTLGPGFLLHSKGISAGRWIAFSVLAAAGNGRSRLEGHHEHPVLEGA